jgi:hypothetical protein
MAAERLDGVNLRVGILDADAARVAAAFDLDPSEAREREIHVLEYLVGGSGLLTAAGATVWRAQGPRSRQVVARLWPVRRARLAPGWSAFYADSRHRLRIAQEWIGTRRILTAALTESLDLTSPAPGSDRDPAGLRASQGLLSARQRDFLNDCAGIVVPDHGLVLLGPIQEQVWALERDDLSLRIRRWRAHRLGETAGLDMIDLEVPTSAEDAPFLFPALRSLAQRNGIDPGWDLAPVASRGLAWALENRR